MGGPCSVSGTLYMGQTFEKTPTREEPTATHEEASAPSSAKDKVGHLGYADQVAALSPDSVQFSGGEHTAASTDQVLSRARDVFKRAARKSRHAPYHVHQAMIASLKPILLEPAKFKKSLHCAFQSRTLL